MRVSMLPHEYHAALLESEANVRRLTELNHRLEELVATEQTRRNEYQQQLQDALSRMGSLRRKITQALEEPERAVEILGEVQ